MNAINVDEMRSMTLLNEMGDIEVAWDSQNDNEMREVIARMMKEGVRFFILKPMVGSILYREAVLKKMGDLKDRKVKIKDADLEALATAGKIAVFRSTSNGQTIETAGVAKTPEEAARKRTVGVKAMSGG